MHRTDTVTPCLRGLTVLVTRPAHQAAAFCAMLERRGAVALSRPALRICEPADLGELERAVARLDAFDLLMFNRPTAATPAIEFINARRRLPEQVLIAAIGRATAAAIERYGYRVDVCPASGFDSEALLALPEVAEVRGKRVAIFRGQDGRMLLAETLRQRGAEVEFVTTYRRCGPSPEQAKALSAALRQGVDVVTVASSETLRHLVACLDPEARAQLEHACLITGHPRISATARELGLPEPYTAADPTDASMLAAVLAWAQRRKRS